jgi:hypothetical protein
MDYSNCLLYISAAGKCPAAPGNAPGTAARKFIAKYHRR